MKRFFKAATIVLFTSVLLTACGGDDSSSTPASIIAKWTPTKTIIAANGGRITTNYTGNEAGCDKDYIEFTAANAFNNVVFFKDATNTCTAAPADPSTYTLTENVLVITGDIYGGTYEVTRLTNKELRIETEETNAGVTTTTTRFFTKVVE
ncbi:lipocalin family protein [Flavobacterium sp.]|uniref:lipocalin family protein n=1 Tax=Flavobacterium sp. TaxID=239 RepID=UPI002612E2D6|nr:lipocalin family protein [Flavobacterium sp.]